ncbi:MAG TPA: hypothetical protein PLA01_01360 [Acetivibrio sp.]|nr:hypothetical protein [Acetivibrio sp.]
MFWKNENLLTAKTRLTYASCIITAILALIYSLFFGQGDGLPEYVRTLGILSVISTVVLRQNEEFRG